MANEQQPAQPNLTQAQMLEIVKQFAVEMKKPSAEEQAKIDAEKERLLANQRRSAADAAREKQQRNFDQASCSHMKPHPYVGKTRIIAPLHSDGLHHPRCLFCNKEFKPFAPGPETIAHGMSLGDYAGITPQVIEAWGNRYEKQKENLELVRSL